jgi:nucleotide-binding universal stress UspA family protein
LRDELARYILEQANIRIDALQMEAGTSAEVFIDAGKPSAVVPRVADQFNADLLVLGRHRSDGLVGDLFQNALAIQGGSPCPVLASKDKLPGAGRRARQSESAPRREPR